MQNTIVVRPAGQVIPDTYAEALLKSAQSIGVAIVKDGKLEVERSLFSQSEPPISLAEFKQMQEEFKDAVCVFFTSTEDRDEESLQPYTVLVNAEGDESLVAFLTGDFSQFKQTDSAHTDDFHAADKIVIPFIKKTAKGIESDLVKLLNELDDMSQNMLIRSALADRGSITLVSPAFDPITMHKGEGSSTYPWGWVSDTLGYKETPPKAEEPAAKPRGLLRRGQAALSQTVLPAPAPTEAPKLPDPVKPEGPVEAVPKTDVEAAHQEIKERETEHEMIGPPDMLTGKARERFFNQNCTYKPSNWFEKGAKAPAKKKSVKSLEALGTKITVTSTYEADKAVATLTDKEVAELKSTLVTLDRNMQPVATDIKQIQALEGKVGNFFEKIGQDESYLDGKPFEWYDKLSGLNPRALALLAFNLYVVTKNLSLDLEQLTDPGVVKTQEQIDKKPEVAKTVVAKAEEPRSGLLRRRIG